MTMLPSSYTKKVTSAHISCPKYIAWLDALIRRVCETGNLLLSIPTQFSVRKATGRQLDVIGNSVGVSRSLPYTSTEGLLSDADYRLFILAKILRSRWDGQMGSLISLWQRVYPEISIKIVDNLDMTVSIEVTGDITPAMSEMIQTGLILPIPTGVKATYSVIAFKIPPRTVNLDTGLVAQGQIGTVSQEP